MRTLRLAAAVEAASLAALSVNLLTVHMEEVTALGGPMHGTAYLVVIATTWSMTGSGSARTRWYAAVPGVGGLLVLRRLTGLARHGSVRTPVPDTGTATSPERET
ncbi:hypothetical protein [Streptomyces sp. NPDC047928]|uniref:hypothetical protein n=1 Tax=unclassified Streptomyces TaxID=2593676 RepID=UPI003713D019